MVDVSVWVAKATEHDVGDGMVARQPGVEADGTKDILVARLGNEKAGDYVDLLSDALVQAPNGLDTKQKHRSFGDSLLAKEPVEGFCWSAALRISGIDPD